MARSSRSCRCTWTSASTRREAPAVESWSMAVNGAGGTSGGLGTFFGGVAMIVAGGYLLLTRVTVVGGGWRFYGYDAFGLSLIPLLVGVGLLFFDGRSMAGWLLTAGGALIIVVGIIAN